MNDFIVIIGGIGALFRMYGVQGALVILVGLAVVFLILFALFNAVSWLMADSRAMFFVILGGILLFAVVAIMVGMIEVIFQIESKFWTYVLAGFGAFSGACFATLAVWGATAQLHHTGAISSQDAIIFLSVTTAAIILWVVVASRARS